MAKDPNQSRTETDERPTHYLREWRKFMGWSQEELAEMADVHQSKIARVESGKRGLKAGFLKELARAFKVPASALLEVNPATEEGRQTASMLLAWNKLTGGQRADMLRMMRAIAEPEDKSNAD
jgi:transcriptional regulator with XRE-family HTH domain